MKKILAFVLTITLFSGTVSPRGDFMMKKKNAIAASAGVGLAVGLGTGVLTYYLTGLFDREFDSFENMSKGKRRLVKFLVALGAGSAVGTGVGCVTYYNKFRNYTPEYKVEKIERKLDRVRDKVEFSEKEKAAISKDAKDRTDEDKKIINGYILKCCNNSTRPLLDIGNKIKRLKREASEAQRLMDTLKEFNSGIEVKVKVDKKLEDRLNASMNLVSLLENYVFVEKHDEYKTQLAEYKKECKEKDKDHLDRVYPNHYFVEKNAKVIDNQTNAWKEVENNKIYGKNFRARVFNNGGHY